MSGGKLLLVGSWRWSIYAPALYEKLRLLGADVEALDIEPFFAPTPLLPGPSPRRLLARAVRKLRAGPGVHRLNQAILRRARELRPTWVLFWPDDLIFKSTLQRLAADGILLVVHNNDDPFSPSYPNYVWRRSRANAGCYDLALVYRHANLDDYRAAGARRVALLRSYYIREHNYRLPADQRLRVPQNDIVFIGHWEPDGRDDFIRPLLQRAPNKLRVYGTGWERSPLAPLLGRVRRLSGAQYNEALNGTKIALAFLSGLNRDTYTRRNFEIPAAGTLMLSQHSADLERLFAADREAAYFRSPHELVSQALSYLEDDERRERVAREGHERLLRDGHEAGDRAKYVWEQLGRILS